ncbi:MAG TPA: hypothetical protein VGG05_24445 [Pseudonocardiaceae bacterium]|jgi:hypothetical protein
MPRPNPDRRGSDYLSWEPPHLPEGWFVAPDDMRRRLEAELRAEASDGHPLYGETMIAIARCAGCDDALFSIEGEHIRWAIVHLTWSAKPEKAPSPRAAVLATFTAARQHLARHDH